MCWWGNFRSERTVLYLDCGCGYMTLKALSKLTELYTIRVNFIVCRLKINFKNLKNMSALIPNFHVWIMAVHWCSMQAHDHRGGRCLQLIWKYYVPISSYSNSHLRHEIMRLVSDCPFQGQEFKFVRRVLGMTFSGSCWIYSPKNFYNTIYS